MSGGGAAFGFFDKTTTVNVIFKNLELLHGDMANTYEFDQSFAKRMKIQEQNIKIVEKAYPDLCPRLQESLRTELENCQHTLKMLKEDDIFFEFRLKGKKTVTQEQKPMSKKQEKKAEREAKLPGKKKK